MNFRIETEREADGRWIADIPSLPGVMAYGTTRKEAIARAEALALRVLADQIEQEKNPAEELSVSFTCPRVTGPAQKPAGSTGRCSESAGLRKPSKGSSHIQLTHPEKGTYT
jgi:predicted RNase H-like HicB family nuclease